LLLTGQKSRTTSGRDSAPVSDAATSPKHHAVSTGPKLEPVVGARIRFKPTDQPRYRNKEGVITKITGEGQFAQYNITLDNGVNLNAFATRFDVIKLPSGE
jgi:hypothetical protein